MYRTDIKIGFLCNNRCKFCVQGEKRDVFGNKPKEEIQKNLKETKKEGIESAVFTGGEPTIHQNFFGLVACAKSLGLKIILMQPIMMRSSMFDPSSVSDLEEGSLES